MQKIWQWIGETWLRYFSADGYKNKNPDRVVIEKDPSEEYKNLRGPVTIYWRGLKFEHREIDHHPDDFKNCSSLVYIPKGKSIFFKYNLQDIENLDPADVKYLHLNADDELESVTD